MQQLITLWERTLGTPPADDQFVIWLESHESDIVRRAILKTAIKNKTLGGMSQDHKVRFASKVMLTRVALRKENAVKHEKVREEFDAKMLIGTTEFAARFRPGRNSIPIMVTSHEPETPYIVTGQCIGCGAGYILGEYEGVNYTNPTCVGCGLVHLEWMRDKREKGRRPNER
jgi:hypothetical protein